ncbi:RNA methyltransferase [bacterium]|nr:RNA methyltransferase [bacterium]
MRSQKRMKTYVVLENIRSAHNVGSVFRTADGAGADKVFLTGYTPSPKDRFGRIQKEIKKTSLGASESVSWEQVEDIQQLLKRLKSESVEIIAVEQTDKAIPHQDFIQKKDTAYIFGNEVDGVSEATLAEADVVLEIPMHGTKESLNVSVSVGVVLFSIQQHQ